MIPTKYLIPNILFFIFSRNYHCELKIVGTGNTKWWMSANAKRLRKNWILPMGVETIMEEKSSSGSSKSRVGKINMCRVLSHRDIPHSIFWGSYVFISFIIYSTPCWKFTSILMGVPLTEICYFTITIRSTFDVYEKNVKKNKNGVGKQIYSKKYLDMLGIFRPRLPSS